MRFYGVGKWKFKKSFQGTREKEWQEERGPRYGNQRKKLAFLKWKDRKRERYEKIDVDYGDEL
jgi:hypothetical protein